jgi:hypothetical protein
MPGISVSKVCIPFGGGFDFSSYWTTQFKDAVANDSVSPTTLTAEQEYGIRWLYQELLALNNIEANTFVPGDTATSKIKGFYPFIGSARASLYNMVDPREEDAAFRLVKEGAGAVVHGVYGITFTSNYAFDTKFIPSAHLGNNSAVLGLYCKDAVNNAGTDMGVVTAGSWLTLFANKNGTIVQNSTISKVGRDLDISAFTNSKRSLYVSNRNNDDVKLFINGELKDTLSDNDHPASAPTSALRIGSNNYLGTNYWSNRINRCAVFGSSISDAVQEGIYNALVNFEKNISG